MSTVSLNGVKIHNYQSCIPCPHRTPKAPKEPAAELLLASDEEMAGPNPYLAIPSWPNHFSVETTNFFQYTFRDLLKFKQKQISFTGQTSSTTLGSLRLKMENPRSCKHLMKRCPPKQIPFQDVQ